MPFEGFGSTLSGLGFAISVLGFGVYYFGLRVWGLRFLVSLVVIFSFRFRDLGFTIYMGLSFGAWGLGFAIPVLVGMVLHIDLLVRSGFVFLAAMWEPPKIGDPNLIP